MSRHEYEDWKLLRVSDNPPLTWPQGRLLGEFTGRWWVAHTKSRNEKALAHDLVCREVSYFLPMTWKVRHNRRRKIKALLPLFGGYLFFCADEKKRIEVLKTNRVASLIEVKDQEKLINELSAIERALRAGAALHSHKYIEAGRRCRVTAGALRDIEGVIEKSRAGARLILKIDMLGQAASVEVDSDVIEIIE